MGDIAAEAGVSHGTVYTYFETKRDVMAIILERLVADLRAAISIDSQDDEAMRLAQANRSYIDTYVNNARLMMVMEEAAMSDGRFAQTLRELRQDHISRVAEQIAAQQKRGEAHADVNAGVAALGMCAMVEGFARYWADSDDPGDSVGAASVTLLWQRALGLPEFALAELVESMDTVEEPDGVHV